jgi:hypothetical protein
LKKYSRKPASSQKSSNHNMPKSMVKGHPTTT